MDLHFHWGGGRGREETFRKRLLFSCRPPAQGNRRKAGGSALAFPPAFIVSLPLPCLHPMVQALPSEAKQQQGKVETELGVSWEGTQVKGSEGSGGAEVESVEVKGNRSVWA